MELKGFHTLHKTSEKDDQCFCQAFPLATSGIYFSSLPFAAALATSHVQCSLLKYLLQKYDLVLGLSEIDSTLLELALRG